MNSTLKLTDVQAQDVTFQHNFLSYLFGLLITTYIVWQYFLRTEVMWSASSEPPMLPYWIPVVGHTFSFLTDNHNTIMSGRSYLKSAAQPFSLFIGGRRTYIVLDPRYIGEVFKKTKDLVYEPFVENLMTCLGVTEKARDIMLSTKIGDPPPSLANSVLDWVRVEMSPGPSSQPFFDKLMTELDLGLQQGSPLTNGREISTNNFFGKVLLEQSPEILHSFPIFDRHAWEMVFRAPKLMFNTAHSAKSSVINSLTKYLELPQSQRQDAASFILRSEDAMRKNGVGSRDIAAMVFKLFWGINGMPAIVAFWLLARTVYTPDLWEAIKTEVAPAFKNGIHSQPDIEYLKGCLKLNAIFYETLRVHGGANGFRTVSSDTVIGGFTFKTGSDVLMPYRQMHLDEVVWGQDAKTFDINRFIDNPKLAAAKTFKPFGGGTTLCPGRFHARHTALSFIATIVTRYNIQVVGGYKSEAFHKMNTRGSEVGVVYPVLKHVPKIIVKNVDIE
ncbi:hypothetical protein FAUST_927 [Fusarium austroamericanum]|uniref:Cytochrome P450 n=1 Tax=Fusarium austroamericanum TaxID=282268 RepID=A0AAN6CA24_FUSAU|nr:hypothetical protein FAUST_927 [Fusarium austroamericanum]